MPNAAKWAVALLPLMACGAPSTSAAPATSEPSPFAAPQPAAPTVAGTQHGAATQSTPQGGMTSGRPEIRIVDASPRASDLGAAVVATFPTAVERLGSPSRIHVHVEGIDAPSPGQAVVVFLGVEFGAAAPPPARRIAVPAHWDGERWAAGTPWDLPPSPSAMATDALIDATLPADDPELLALAVDALEAAGWSAVVIESLRVPIEGWAHPVAFEATRRTERSGRARHVVWLRRHLDRLVVAGTRVSATPDHATPHEQDPA